MDIDTIARQIQNLNLEQQPRTNAEVRLLEYCRKLPPPFDNIGPVLKANNAVIAGSAVVHALRPGPWTSNDIDIFCPEAFVLPLEYLLSKNHWKAEWFFTYTYTWFVDGAVSHAQVYSSHNGGRINIISLFDVNTAPEVIQKIQETFDLDGCAVCYDGDRIHMNPRMKVDDFLNDLWTYNLQGLASAIDLVENRIPVPIGCYKDWLPRYLNVFFHRARDRIQKYSARGIRVVNGFEILSMLVKNYQR